MIESLLMLKPMELGRLIKYILCDQSGRRPLPELIGAERYILPMIQAVTIEPVKAQAVVIAASDKYHTGGRLE